MLAQLGGMRLAVLVAALLSLIVIAMGLLMPSRSESVGEQVRAMTLTRRYPAMTSCAMASTVSSTGPRSSRRIRSGGTGPNGPTSTMRPVWSIGGRVAIT